jgi:hypothetical protein
MSICTHTCTHPCLQHSYRTQRRSSRHAIVHIYHRDIVCWIHIKHSMRSSIAGNFPCVTYTCIHACMLSCIHTTGTVSVEIISNTAGGRALQINFQLCHKGKQKDIYKEYMHTFMHTYHRDGVCWIHIKHSGGSSIAYDFPGAIQFVEMM